MSVGGAHRARRPRRARYEGFCTYIKRVGTGPKGSTDLTLAEARSALGAVLDRDAEPAQIGAFLVACRIKGDSAAEIAGFAAALRKRSARLPGLQDARPVVACAGGYDGVVEGPQLSLAAAALAAAAGAAVVMHGGPPLGPKHGVTAPQVAEALGAPPPAPAVSAAVLRRTGIGLFSTPRICPAWEALRPLREAIAVRTPVNAAEKLLAPVAVDAFVLGVTHLPYATRMLEALRLLGARRAIVVRGIEGSDVPRPVRPAALELADGQITELVLEDADALLPAGATGGAEASAQLTRELLDGSAAPGVTRAALLGAGLRLYGAGLAASPAAGTARAAGALESGAATAVLERFIAAARETAGREPVPA